MLSVVSALQVPISSLIRMWELLLSSIWATFNFQGTSGTKAALGKTIMNIFSGDQGNVPSEDIKESELSLEHGFLLLRRGHLRQI